MATIMLVVPEELCQSFFDAADNDGLEPSDILHAAIALYMGRGTANFNARWEILRLMDSYNNLVRKHLAIENCSRYDFE